MIMQNFFDAILCLRIEKTVEFRYSTQKWSWGPPKTKQGVRTLKMTNKAYEILKEMWDNRSENHKTPEEFKNLVFLNRTGYPTKNSTYDAALVKRILGHSSIKITVDTYVHETEQTIEEATAKFSNYLDSMFD